jgi:hypothetical protein
MLCTNTSCIRNVQCGEKVSYSISKK